MVYRYEPADAAGADSEALGEARGEPFVAVHARAPARPDEWFLVTPAVLGGDRGGVESRRLAFEVLGPTAARSWRWAQEPGASQSAPLPGFGAATSATAGMRWVPGEGRAVRPGELRPVGCFAPRAELAPLVRAIRASGGGGEAPADWRPVDPGLCASGDPDAWLVAIGGHVRCVVRFPRRLWRRAVVVVCGPTPRDGAPDEADELAPSGALRGWLRSPAEAFVRDTTRDREPRVTPRALNRGEAFEALVAAARARRAAG
jgi:hypothetical protein